MIKLTSKERIDLFSKEIDFIHNPDVKMFVERALAEDWGITD